jgi:predicted dithiol-disulfide oxidoreductase (DUF899 family)
MTKHAALERVKSGSRKAELGAPKVVDRSTFQAELDALRVREKAHTREGDAIAAARRRLPMVEVDPAITLIGAHGPATLLEPGLQLHGAFGADWIILMYRRA